MENENKPIEDNEGTEKDGSYRKVDALDMYADLMSDCFAEANKLLKNQVRDPHIISDTARAIFNRCTREMPEQGKIFDKALEYLAMLMKDKEAASEYMPPAYAPFVTSAPSCQHPGLKALHLELTALSDPGVGEALNRVVKAMTIVGPTEDGYDYLVCSHCRAFVSLEIFRDGTLWD